MRLNKALAWAVSTGLLIFFLSGPTAQAYRNVVSPAFGAHQARDVIPAGERRSEDLIYVYYGAVPAFTFYASQYGIDERNYSVGVASRDNPDRYLEDLEKLRGKPRVWFVFSHNCPPCEVDERLFMLEHLDTLGRRMGEYASGGSAVYLYDLTQSGK